VLVLPLTQVLVAQALVQMNTNIQLMVVHHGQHIQLELQYQQVQQVQIEYKYNQEEFVTVLVAMEQVKHGQQKHNGQLLQTLLHQQLQNHQM
jgi:hypothetical protein